MSIERKKLLRTALMGSTATLAGGAALVTVGGNAYAQEDEEQVFVTGSRIPRQDIEANSPVAVVGAEEIALTGNVQVENLLNDLPQVVPGLTTVNNNPGGAGSTVDLRGIGVSRTLVLVNGRRWLPSSLSGYTDVQTIPTGMVERIEVVTGGASAVYGSDAISGVVNFILKDDFEGLTATGQYDIHAKGDGERVNLDATMGANFADGRGNVLINVSWFKQNPIFQGDRTFTQVPCATFSQFIAPHTAAFPTFTSAWGTNYPSVPTTPVTGSENALCGWLDSSALFGGPGGSGTNHLIAYGSSRIPNGKILGVRGSTSFNNAYWGFINYTSSAAFNDAGNFGGSTFGGTANCGPEELTGGDILCSYNYSPPNYLQLPLTRTTMNLAGHYDINDDIEFFMDASFVNIDTATRLAPVPMTTRVNFNTSNPFFDGKKIRSANPFSGNGNRDLVNALANAACSRFNDPNNQGDPTKNCGSWYTAPTTVAYTSTAFSYSAYTFNYSVLGFTPLEGEAARAWLYTHNNGNMPFRVSKRMVEVGARENEQDRDLFQFTVGFRGAFANGWNWETYYQYAKFRNNDSVRNDVHKARFRQALDVRRTVLNTSNGVPTSFANDTSCALPAGQDPFSTALSGPCVPMWIFGTDALTPAQVQYIKTDATQETEFEREMFGFALNGTLVEMPAGPLGFAVGVEARRESGRFSPDDVYAQGYSGGFNAVQPTRGRINVWEFYAEALVPLVSDKTLIKYLAMEGGLRWSKYSTAGSIFTWKLGGEWRPFDDLKVRGLFQRAVRAPNISELFAGSVQSFPSYVDPCRGSSVAGDPDIAAACEIWTAGTWTSAFIQQDSQVQAAFYSNPNLSEETSNTWSIGGVITPSFIPNLEVMVDYYSITLKNGVGSSFGGPGGTISNCLEQLVALGAPGLNSVACQRAPRDPTNGYQLGTTDPIAVYSQNLSLISTTGLDVSLKYNFDMEQAIGIPGSMSLEGMYTHVFSVKSQTFADDPTTAFDCAGFHSCGGAAGGAVFDDKIAARATYRNGAYALSLRWTGLGSLANPYQYVRDCEGVLGGLCVPGSLAYPYQNGIGWTHVLDVTFSWDINDTVQVILGVDNVLNAKPPFLGVFFGVESNTDPSTFSSQLLGPRFFGRVTANF